MMRSLPVSAGAPFRMVSDGLQDWLAAGARAGGIKKSSAWYLAQKAVVVLVPAEALGRIVWPVSDRT
jgi:hypothetical protein